MLPRMSDFLHVSACNKKNYPTFRSPIHSYGFLTRFLHDPLVTLPSRLSFPLLPVRSSYPALSPSLPRQRNALCDFKIISILAQQHATWQVQETLSNHGQSHNRNKTLVSFDYYVYTKCFQGKHPCDTICYKLYCCSVIWGLRRHN